MTSHLDEFILLRSVAGDLADDERKSAASHVTDCPTCSATISELERLDGELRRLASTGSLAEDPAAFSLSDPFRRRPLPRKAARAPGNERLAATAIAASDRGLDLQERILEVVRKRPDSLLPELSLADPEHRFALLYTLQQAGREIAENPVRALAFAQVVLQRLRREATPQHGPVAPAEQMVPRHVLWAQAHLLTALACMWTKDFARAQWSLLVAYRSFARGRGDETSLAVVELTEAQRRAFVHKGASSLILARRASATFKARGMEDLAARAWVAEGLAYSDLDREEDAVQAFRRALPIFERYELWSNYVGGLNSIATSLTKLGRVDEARREYARALRRFSQERHRYMLGYIRTGLAETLFAAGRFSEAAVSSARAAQVFWNCGLRANALIASLLEIESWARHGSLVRARHRLNLFWDEIQRDQTIDPTVARDIADALSGTNPDFEKLATLRQQAEALLQSSSDAKGA
jgi:tetratricopeptide (TPR) repeat protein